MGSLARRECRRLSLASQQAQCGAVELAARFFCSAAVGGTHDPDRFSSIFRSGDRAKPIKRSNEKRRGSRDSSFNLSVAQSESGRRVESLRRKRKSLLLHCSYSDCLLAVGGFCRFANLRQCIECKTPFFATDNRQRFCPPPAGVRESRCGKRHQMREFRNQRIRQEQATRTTAVRKERGRKK